MVLVDNKLRKGVIKNQQGRIDVGGFDIRRELDERIDISMEQMLKVH